MEDLRGKGGGRLKHRTIDGDVPLCLGKMRKTATTTAAANERRAKHCVMNKMASGSKDMCPRSTEKKDEDTKNKEVTFIVLQKT